MVMHLTSLSGLLDLDMPDLPDSVEQVLYALFKFEQTFQPILGF